MLGFVTLQYPALHDLINIPENPDSIFACKTEENKEENELFITFPVEHISFLRF